MRNNNENTTIKDVAKLADVSTATVSRVLNEPRTVSEKLTKKVKEAISDLDYQPSRLAKSLKTNKTFTIGLMITDIESPFYAKIMKGVEDKIFEHDFTLLVSNTDEELQKEKLYMELFSQSRLDGLIISPTGQYNELIQKADKEDYPIVFLDRSISDINVDTVLADNVSGAYKATNYLIDKGHKRIGMISGIKQVTSSSERVKGYKKALKERNLDFNEKYLIQGGYTEEGGYQATKNLLSLKERPTAVFSANGRMTLGAIKLLREKGYSYPEDISLLSFDDYDVFSILEPNITAIQQPSYEIGSKAAEILIQRIDDKEKLGEASKYRLPVELKIRRSVAEI